ncbi:MAG: VCBS repeat-containing protein [Planctomycetota bacterium]
MRVRRLVLLALPALAPAGGASAQAFAERAAELGLTHEFVSGLDRIGSGNVVDQLQAGMAVGDLDGDGDLDVVCCGGVGLNSVFLNEGGVFVDASEAAGIEVGELDRAPALADYDGDGDLDLFLGALDGGDGDLPGRSRLYRNDGAATFDEVTTVAGTTGAGHSIFAQWYDLDLDGLLDLYVCEFHGSLNRWYRNNGDGSFTEAAEKVGIAWPGAAHASAIADTDGDGLPEVAVGNDYIVAFWTSLSTNAGDGLLHHGPEHLFTDVTPGSGCDHMRGIMGLAWADVDYDGDLDLYKTDVEDNYLMINAGWPGSGAPWVERQDFYGVTNPTVPDPEGGEARSVGWAAVFLHADRDPWLDLFVVNGKVGGASEVNPFSSSDQQNFLFLGEGPGASFTFRDASLDYGFAAGIDDRGAAIGDLDGDGDPELLVSPANGELRCYVNEVDPASGGTLVVEARGHTSAPGGIGARVSWTDALGWTHVVPIGGDGPTASQHDARAYLALGAEAEVDVTVQFPSGLTRTYAGVPAGSTLVAEEPELLRVPFRARAIASTAGPGAYGLGGLPLSSIFEVRAFAHDAAGTPLDASASVAIEIEGLTALGGVEHVAANEFRRAFRTPVEPGSFRVRAQMDDFAVRVEPVLRFYAAGDVSATTVALVPEAVRAASADLVEVQVAPKAKGGVLQRAVGHVQVALGGAPPIASAQEGALWTFAFAAPDKPGLYPVAVVVDGQVVAAPDLEVAGVGSAAQTTVYHEEPSHVQAMAPHQLKLKITPRDAAGLRLGPEAQLALVPMPDAGTAEVVLRADLWPRGQRDGEFVFVLEKPLASEDNAAAGSLQLLVDGEDLGLWPYQL